MASQTSTLVTTLLGLIAGVVLFALLTHADKVEPWRNAFVELLPDYAALSASAWILFFEGFVVVNVFMAGADKRIQELRGALELVWQKDYTGAFDAIKDLKVEDNDADTVKNFLKRLKAFLEAVKGKHPEPPKPARTRSWFEWMIDTVAFRWAYWA